MFPRQYVWHRTCRALLPGAVGTVLDESAVLYVAHGEVSIKGNIGQSMRVAIAYIMSEFTKVRLRVPGLMSMSARRDVQDEYHMIVMRGRKVSNRGGVAGRLQKVMSGNA